MWDGIRVSAIAAVGSDGAVGKDGQLPWRIPSDLKWFKSKTKGHAIVMGRRTRDELGKPLKRRKNVVLSRTLLQTDDGFVIAGSWQEALDLAAAHERAQVAAGKVTEAEILVIGGPTVWTQVWSIVDRFYWTQVQQVFAADTYWPDVDLDSFQEVSRVDGVGDIPHVFVVLERVDT